MKFEYHAHARLDYLLSIGIANGFTQVKLFDKGTEY